MKYDSQKNQLEESILELLELTNLDMDKGDLTVAAYRLGDLQVLYDFAEYNDELENKINFAFFRHMELSSLDIEYS